MASDGSAVQDHDSKLTDMLRLFRKRISRLQGKPAFRVFHDSTLYQLVDLKPRHPQQLEKIPRFGPATIGAHGAGVLRVIDEWADWRWKDLLDPVDTREDTSAFEDALGDSSWTKVLTQLYLSFSRGRPRVTSKDLVLRTGCSEETVRRVLVRMDQKGIIDRGGRGEGHMLDPMNAEDLIYALERIEGRRKSNEIGHLIEHLRVTGIVDRSSAIDDGILELLDGDPVKMHGFLEDPVEAAVWAENRLRNVLESSADGVVHYRYALSNGARPDAAIRMPDGSMLCIDAMLPIGEFRNLAEDPSMRKSFLGSLKFKIRTTGEKYVDSDVGTAPFCILYLPSDRMLERISVLDPSILKFALDQKVIIASPMSLVFILSSLDESPTINQYLGFATSWPSKMAAKMAALSEGEKYPARKWIGDWHKEFGDWHKESHRSARVSVRTQDSEKKIVSAMIERYRSRKEDMDIAIRGGTGKDMNIVAREYSWISRNTLFEKSGLECGNSRFSQILGGMEDRGIIERSYGENEGVVYVKVALRSGAQRLFGSDKEEASELAEMFDDSGNLTLLPP